MDAWQIALYSIIGFISCVGGLIGTVRFNHYTKKEIDDKFESVAKDHQTIPMCNNNHNTANQAMTEIKNGQARMLDKFDELKLIVIRYFGHEREKE